MAWHPLPEGTDNLGGWINTGALARIWTSQGGPLSQWEVWGSLVTGDTLQLSDGFDTPEEATAAAEALLASTGGTA